MKVTLKENICIVEATEPDEGKKYRNGGWGSAESRFLYHVKKELIKQGYDVIKKRMYKDGHLMGDDDMQYIRSRKINKEAFCIYDPSWAVRDLINQFKTEGKVILNKDALWKQQ